MYYLHYVESCSPKLKMFKSKKALDKFTKEFKSDWEDSWIEFAFESKSIMCYDPYYLDFLMEPKPNKNRKSNE